jgi:hypothetical protein
MRFKSLSGPLQSGIRFFHDPLPAPSSAFLAIGFPGQLEIPGDKYGFTQFHISNKNGLGLAFPPVALQSTCANSAMAHPATYLLVRAYSAAVALL